MATHTPSPITVDDDATVVLRYAMDDEERPSEALPEALAAANLDPMTADTVLHDWIDGDAVDSLLGGSGPDHRLSTVIWDHQVVITPDEITVYGN